jgi:heterodisulfide reductase subunit A-like polyferredoxin
MGNGAAVIGGGIAGVQAALDLAEQGIRVYLIEKSPTLGGKMAQLDKTFPTNDCSICILSPKLVAAGRHPKITLITNSKVKSLEGEAGNFNLTIHTKARYIDMEKCTACNLCTDVCPVDVDSEFDCELGKRTAIHIPFPQAVPLKYVVDRRGIPPCQASCPADVRAQGYIALISKGKFQEALDLHRRHNPLPLLCGSVCPHPCETSCNRGELDSPLAIAALKRFMAEFELEHGKDPVEPFERTRDKKIAVIGSGPAGLTTAYFLSERGYEVTIFEALPVAGGMLAVGIPDYRLPKDTLEAEIDFIKKKGVDIRLNSAFGRDITLASLRKEGYDAVFLGIGAHNSKKLEIPGEDLSGVIAGVEFLRDVNLGNKVNIGKKVAIIGGGDVAVDAVRVASRLGTEAFILYRRTRNEMPAHESEIQEAVFEGIDIHFLTQPVRILEKGGKVAGLECIKMELGEPDESGRQRPVPVKGSEFTMDVDCVLPAIGQKTDLSLLKGLELDVTKTGSITADEFTYATNVPGVFAAGDAVTGPATVVSAVGAGKKAAAAIHAYLNDKELTTESEEDNIISYEDLALDEHIERKERVKVPELPPPKRKGNFNEIINSLSEEEAVSEAQRCLNCGVCSGCHQCLSVCEPDAIDFTQKDEELKLDVGSVVVTAGYDLIDPDRREEFGYGIYDDVVTALEFERILSASGPFRGHIRRVSDGIEPEKIAFVQCVGSRDKSCGVGYCSAVCCMYAIKEAIIAKEHSPGLDVTIFHMDIRAFGKEFEYYYKRAQDIGITFKRCRVADIEEDCGQLRLNFAEEAGEPNHGMFDIVVLSNGIVPDRGAEELAQALGIELEEHGFAKTSAFTPLETTRKGVFVSGAFSEPKDIPDTVAQASGATVKAAQFSEPEEEGPVCIPEERDAAGEPRIGVLICHCGINIGNFVDVKSVADYASSLPNVVYAENVLYACSQDVQDKIKNLISEHELNRVIVASCTPRTHEPLFQETIESAGLNPYLFEMTNIREHCSWVHMDEKEKATEKAKDLVRMTVAKSNLLKPLERECLSVNSACLVLGGGISGLTAARDLGDAGFNVYLLEREKELGGNLRHVSALISGEDTKPYLDGLISEVESHKNIEVYSGADVRDIQGYVGNFTTTFSHEGTETEVNHGAVIVATGGRPYEPEQYLYGTQKNVVTQLDLENMLAKGTFKAGSVVMIQCVGFRDDTHGYCARVCCSQAVKNTLRIKEVNPEADIYILYKDLRTYGFLEDHYLSASTLGVRFIRYDDDNKPDVSGGKKLNVTIMDPVLGETLMLEPELLVLSSGMEPREDNKTLASMLKVPISKDGFFLEAHMKLRPLDFATDGIFLCGAAHSPKFVSECISQASGAAARAATVLGKQSLMAEGIVSSVDEELCFGCGICVASCPYNAVELDDEAAKAKVISALCKGCGVCGATCPKHAISLGHFTDSQVMAQIEAFIEGVE